jgi:hypothetical protein
MPGEGVSRKGKGGDGLGVEGVEESRWGGIAVGLFVFLADFGLAFDFELDLDEDGVFVDFCDLLGVLVDVVGVLGPPAGLGPLLAGVEEAVSGGSPRSLDGPASGVASWAWWLGSPVRACWGALFPFLGVWLDSPAFDVSWAEEFDADGIDAELSDSLIFIGAI